MADDAAEARAAATQEAPDGLREKVQVMDNLIETVTFFRNTDPNVSLIVIGIMLTWTLAAGSFLLARLGIKPLWVLLLVLPGLNVLAIWLFAYARWPRYEEARRKGWTPDPRQ